MLVLSVGSLLINFLELLWEPAKNVAFLSFMHYYRPVGMLMAGSGQVSDLGIHGGIAVVLWVTAGVVMGRRALTTL